MRFSVHTAPSRLRRRSHHGNGITVRGNLQPRVLQQYLPKPDITSLVRSASFRFQRGGEELHKIDARLLAGLGIRSDMGDAALSVVSEGISELGRTVEAVETMCCVCEDPEREMRRIGWCEITDERFASALAIVEIVVGADENPQRGIDQVRKLETGLMVVEEASGIERQRGLQMASLAKNGVAMPPRHQ